MRSSSFRKSFVPDSTEVKRILDELKREPDPSITVGHRVRCISGPFKGFSGIVESIEDGRLRASINIFGRATPVDFCPTQVEKL